MVPILLLIPSILILLVLIIFIIIIIRDKLAVKGLAMPSFDEIGKKEVKEEEVGEEKEVKEERGVKEEKEVSKGEEVKEEIDYYSKIRELEERLDEMDAKTAYKELINIVRKFFSDYLDLNYEFTYEELENELKEKKKNIVISPDALSKIEYGPYQIPKSELIKMIEEFKNMVKRVKEPAISYDFSEDIKKIEELIAKGKKIWKKDLNKAVDIYKQIYSLYYKLPRDGKIKEHDFILEFYKLIG